ncbi:cell division protein FtsW [Acetitomaculum ruminis DSM 5522]|uniref:Probable peptidoglycan glycosyltransferase FtsW n=1 Tax=Acetitomaculum ruminis DSM 5522 TaxID=1120918 RepID=A0A1I0VVR3_9FIRM|nr:putative peptidoglycan glycosyltransferase FtsW [Acetitomaculum ruminis]SFA80137.1 cell division protein FtsW [Acetitomaculum ruminis DSM 5522]
MAQDKRGKKKKYFDYQLLFLLIFLICFGMVMLYSATYYTACLSSVSNYDDAFYLKQQLKNLAIAVVVFFMALVFPYRLYKYLAFPAYIVSFLLSVLVLFIGKGANGSTRWIKLGPIRFQPSEIAKVATIMILAYMISEAPKIMEKVNSLIKVGVMLGILILPIALENLSTAVIIAGIAFIMLFIESRKKFVFLLPILAGAAGVWLFINLASYRMQRIAQWIHPEKYPDDAYQTLHGLYAIGSGGLFGKGLGNGTQKLGYIPEAQNDMIFSVICEELGIIGAICVLLLFALILYRMREIAMSTTDLFASLLVIGVMAHVGLQVVLNVCVVTNLLPNTGVTLPFISYGGTSLMFLLAEFGVVFNVSLNVNLGLN